MSRVQKETSFRHLLEQLRAIDEHDETAPAAFRFLYSTLTKHMDAYSSSYYKNMQLISYQSKTGLVMGRAVRSAV